MKAYFAPLSIALLIFPAVLRAEECIPLLDIRVMEEGKNLSVCVGDPADPIEMIFSGDASDVAAVHAAWYSGVARTEEVSGQKVDVRLCGSGDGYALSATLDGKEFSWTRLFRLELSKVVPATISLEVPDLEGKVVVNGTRPVYFGKNTKRLKVSGGCSIHTIASMGEPVGQWVTEFDPPARPGDRVVVTTSGATVERKGGAR